MALDSERTVSRVLDQKALDFSPEFVTSDREPRNQQGYGMQIHKTNSLVVKTAGVLFCLLVSSLLYSQTTETTVNFLLQQADSLRSAGNRKQAEIAYRKVLVFQKKSMDALLGLGRIAYERNNWGEAQDWFKKALGVDPENEQAKAYFANPRLLKLIRSADSLRVQKKYRAATEKFKEALEIDRDSVPALVGLGKMAHEKDDWTNVKKWFKKVLQLEPDHEEAKFLLTSNPRPETQQVIDEASELVKEGKYNEAEKTYKRALKTYAGSLNAFRGLGKLAFQRKDWGGIKNWYGKVLEVVPEDLQANYYLGIAYRETGKFKAFLLKKRDFNKSKERFEFVINADSSFRDVLYQRGLLEKVKNHYLNAVKWGHRQVNLKPDLTPAHVGLFKFYRLFLRHSNVQTASKWLKRNPGAWSTYVSGELARLTENYEKAESVFRELLQQNGSISDNLICLSLVRLYLQQGRQDVAGQYFELALNSIETDLDAEYLFEDSKYLFTDAELKQFRSLTDAADKRAFFQRFWTSRNPLPVSTTNFRAMEHYKRLIVAEKNYWYDGLRSWGNNPDKVGYLKFPKAYSENEEFNDKGLIYIRHGHPDEVAKTAGPLSSNESWHYYKRPDRPEFIFHFLKEDRLSVGNNWQLAATLPDLRMVLDRVGWDPKLDRLLTASSELEIASVQNQIADESYLVVKKAMTSDSHTWDKGTKELSMPHYLAYFRGQDNKTCLEVYYGLYVHELRPSDGQTSSALLLEHGAGVYDMNWRTVDQLNDEVPIASIESNRRFGNIFINKYVLDLVPGTYHLALFAGLEGTRKLGGDNIEIEVPVMHQKSFDMSDLELAFNITSVSGNSVFDKGQFEVIPNPTRVFKKSDEVNLYFEIYNLTPDEHGETLFEIESKMARAKKKKGVLGFLGGGKKEVVSIKNERAGDKDRSQEVTSFDVSKLEKGEYELTVKVKDLHSGETSEKSISLTLTDK